MDLVDADLFVAGGIAGAKISCHLQQCMELCCLFSWLELLKYWWVPLVFCVSTIEIHLDSENICIPAMKLSRTLLVVATFATTAVCQSEFTTKDNEGKTLAGQEAVDYLFKYDPSRPHRNDEATGYDYGYLRRVCAPREATGEQFEYKNDQPAVAEMPVSFGDVLADYRGRYSSSPFPCERMKWIRTECGVVDPYFYEDEETKTNATHAAMRSKLLSNISVEDQNKCLCDGGAYWVALNACNACFHKHVGNDTLKTEDQNLVTTISNSMCTPAPSAEPSPYFSYVKSFQGDAEVNSTTIVNDAAPGETNPVKYWPGAGTDLVAATIQSPIFVRTVDGTTITMTPGIVYAVTAKANDTITGILSASTKSASSATTAAVGAAMTMAPVGGLMAVAMGVAALL